jgi:hypothetical protein
MRLVGKKVERMNKYGDDLCIHLKDKGAMKLSPALMSKLNITKDKNKIGFAYAEDKNEHNYVYLAPDNGGLAVNKQGIAKNIPHNRDLRNVLGHSPADTVKIFVDSEPITFMAYPEHVFFQLIVNGETAAVKTTEVEEDTWEAVVEAEEPKYALPNTEGGHQMVDEEEAVDSMDIF